jgi:RimJ/RimL family protein N-acetyltransferase
VQIKKRRATFSKDLSLRLLKKSDDKNVCRWLSSSYIVQHSFVVPGPKSRPSDFFTEAYALRHFETLLSDPRRMTFAIMLDDIHVGNVGLKDICWQALTAECFIEIGEADFRGHGLGKLALKELLHRAFFNHGLRKIDLDVLEFNFPAIKVYDRLGFRVQGQSAWHYDEFGQYWRVLRMTINIENFTHSWAQGFVF